MAVQIPIIAILGRPNVGKSTLFNSIYGEKRAVVDDLPGVTRDRNYARVDRFTAPFILVDTGGYEINPEDELSKMVVEQTVLAAEEADIILCIFDGKLGAQPLDQDVVEMLRRYNKPVYFIVNKCDGVEKAAMMVSDFYSLGIDNLIDISALNYRGVVSLVEDCLKSLPNYTALVQSTQAQTRRRDAEIHLAEEKMEAYLEEHGEPVYDNEEEDILVTEAEDESIVIDDDYQETEFAPVFMPDDEDGNDEVKASMELYLKENRLKDLVVKESLSDEEFYKEENKFDLEAEEVEEITVPIRVAVAGRPNVGKSTLFNTLIGEKRSIESAVSGTTRDVIDFTIKREGHEFEFLDTAGLRKQKKVSEDLEHYTVLRSLSAIAGADVVLLVLDATLGVQEQDTKIAGIAHDEGRGLVIVVNKWDLLEKDHKTVKKFTTDVRQALKFAGYAPIVFISALTGKRCPQVIQQIIYVARQRRKRIATGRLNTLLTRAVRKSSPTSYRGQNVKLYFASQVEIEPPRFVLFFNYPKAVHFSYLRYLKNAIRKNFGFDGTDIKFSLRKR